MEIAFPFQVDPNTGNTAAASYDEHVRQMIEQLLFTSPGERVNRPQFGCGVIQLVFAADGPDLANATQAMVQAALQKWLGKRIQVASLQVDAVGDSLNITIDYTVLYTGSHVQATFTR